MDKKPNTEKISKTELINMLAESERDMTKAMAGRSVDFVLSTIIDAVASGKDVTLTGFGTFTSAMSAERVGHNPSTKEEMTIPAKRRVKFKAGKGFKDAVGG